MVHILSIWFLVVAFCGAGLANVIRSSATRNDFVRWGYPPWWGIVAGGLEVASAAMIAFPVSRVAGIVLGAAIVAAALLSVLRHREYSHLAPLSVFVTLIALAAVSS